MLVELLRLLQLATSPASRLLTANTKTRWTSSAVAAAAAAAAARLCASRLEMPQELRIAGGDPPDGQRRCPPPAQRAASTQRVANFGRQAAAGLPRALLRCWAAVCHSLWRGRPAADAPGAGSGLADTAARHAVPRSLVDADTASTPQATSLSRSAVSSGPTAWQCCRCPRAHAFRASLQPRGPSGSRQAEVGAPLPLLEHLRAWLDCQLTVVTGMIRAKIIRRPLREAISRGFSALREIRAKGG